MTASAGRSFTGRHLADWLALVARRARPRGAVLSRAHSRARSFDSRLGAGAAAGSSRRRSAGRHPVWRKGHHRDARTRTPNTGRRSMRGESAPEDAAIIAELRERGAILWARRTRRRSRTGRRRRRATRTTCSTRRAAARADRPRPSPPAWCRWRSARRRRDRCSARRPSVGSRDSSRRTDSSRWRASCPLRRRLDTLGFFTATAADMLALWKRPGLCRQMWGGVPAGEPQRRRMWGGFRRLLAPARRTRRLALGSPNHCPRSSLRWRRHFRTLCLGCAPQV